MYVPRVHSNYVLRDVHVHVYQQLCAQYWSERKDTFDRQFGELSIHTISYQQMSGYAIHKMDITNRRVSE